MSLLSAFSLSRLLPFVVAWLPLVALGAQDGPRPGNRPGTEQWLVWLRDRSFDLRQEIQQIRSTPTRAQRAAMLTQLDGHRVRGHFLATRTARTTWAAP